MSSDDHFAETRERVRQSLQQGRPDSAHAIIESALKRPRAAKDRLLFLRLDVARGAHDAVRIDDTLTRILALAHSESAVAVRCVSSLRVRGMTPAAWQLLASLAAHSSNAVEAYHLGLDFAQQQRNDLARDCYRYALAGNGEFAEAHVNLGHLLLAEQQFLQALPHFETATRLRPPLQGGWVGLAQCLLHTGRGALASHALAQIDADVVQPAQLLAWRATAAAQIGADATALERYRLALDTDPSLYDAWFGSALIHERQGDLAAAADAYARASALRPQSMWALGAYVYCLQCMADWSRWQGPHADLLCRLSRREVGDYAAALTSLDLPGTVLRQVATQFMRTQSALHVTPAPPRRVSPRRAGRLRVAYMSSDFRDHATSRLLAGTLEQHDRHDFEWFGIALHPADDSAIGHRVRTAFDQLIDATDLSTEQLAARIADAGIDLLVDLNGHTKGSRPGLHALRPAPISVNYLGYPGSMGDYVDYVIGDIDVMPVGADDEFSETIVRLPRCYQPNDRRRDVGAPTDRTQHGLPADAIVACSFNQSWKLTPSVWSSWERLLRTHRSLVLWLLEENPWFQANLVRHALAAGIDAARLVFAPRLPQPQHLARLALADLALDTLPYGSHTTAADALWMGVPFVTRVGATFAGRVGASLLHAVDLPELIAYNDDDYTAKLDALIAAPDALARLKAVLLARRDTAALFDSAACARALEQAYGWMHEHAAQGRL